MEWFGHDIKRLAELDSIPSYALFDPIQIVKLISARTHNIKML
jgi:hypothetical protein